MAQNETVVMTTNIVFSEDKEHRYLLSKEWDSTKKSACVIMLAPANANGVTVDMTTMFVINNLYRLDYGKASIINLFSKINCQLKNNKTLEGLTDEANNNAIVQAVQESDTAIICWGTASKGNKKIKLRAQTVCALLAPHKDKLFEIHGSHGEQGFHPLHPSLRSQWILKPFELPETPQEPPEDEKPKNKQRGRKKQEQDKIPTEVNADQPEQPQEQTVAVAGN